MSVVNQKGFYFITYQETTYKIKRNPFTQKASSIEKNSSKDEAMSLTKKDIIHIEHALKSFDKIKALALSVDKKGNVFISLPWYNKCTCYFLKLSSSNTLKNIKKQYYTVYEGDWYMYEECSER